jgi:hypothetical protein
MSGTVDGDDALLAELEEVLRRHDGPSGDVIAAAKGLFTWRSVDAELASLTFDSLLDDEPAAVRTTTAAPLRMLTFETDGLAVEVEVAERRLAGQLVPAQAAGIELVTSRRTVRATADHLGRFVLALPAEPTRSTLLVRCGRDRVVTAVAVL